jgi:hypothetical protein
MLLSEEAIAEKNAVEINANKTYDFIVDKLKLSEETKDYQLNAIRNRNALVINCGLQMILKRYPQLKKNLKKSMVFNNDGIW